MKKDKLKTRNNSIRAEATDYQNQKKIVIDESPSPAPTREEMEETKVDSKVVRYWKFRKQGMNKGDAQIEAGYQDKAHASRIEESKPYQRLEKYYKNVLLDVLPLEEIARLNKRNAQQSENLNASNQAISLALQYTQDKFASPEDDERLVVILREPKKVEAEITDVEVEE